MISRFVFRQRDEGETRNHVLAARSPWRWEKNSENDINLQLPAAVLTAVYSLHLSCCSGQSSFVCERHRALCSSSLSKHPRRSTMPQVAICENSDRLQDTGPCFPGSLWSSFNTHTHTDRDYLGGRPFQLTSSCSM